MAVGDVWQSRALFSDTLTGRTSSVGLHHQEQAGGALSVGAVEDVWVDWWNLDLPAITGPAQKTHHPAALQMDAVTLRKVVPLDPVIAQSTVGLPIIGTGVGDGLPPNVATVISLRTAFIGKRFRGRIFLPRIIELDSTGAVTDAEATEMSLHFETLIERFITEGFPAGVLTRPAGYTPPGAGPPTIAAVTEVRVDRRLRRQGRRQPSTPVYITTVV